MSKILLKVKIEVINQFPINSWQICANEQFKNIFHEICLSKYLINEDK